MELPKQQKNFTWLFPDSLVNMDYKLIGANGAYKTKKGSVCSVLILVGHNKGKDGKIYENQECLLLTGLINNYEDLVTSLKDIPMEKIFFKISSSDGKTFDLTLVEAV